MSHYKALILADNKSIASFLVIGKRLCSILCSMLMKQVLDLNSSYITGDNTICTDTILHLTKNDLSSLTKHF